MYILQQSNFDKVTNLKTRTIRQNEIKSGSHKMEIHIYEMKVKIK